MKINTNSDLLISPVITEKTTLLQERGKYTFKVAKEATNAASNNFHGILRPAQVRGRCTCARKTCIIMYV